MADRAEDVADNLAIHDETKWGPLTTEFAAMVVLIVAVLIAAAVCTRSVPVVALADNWL